MGLVQSGCLRTSEEIPIDAFIVDYFMHRRICKKVHEKILQNARTIWNNGLPVISSRTLSL